MSHASSKVEKGEELKVIIRLVHTRIIGLSSHKLSYKLEYFLSKFIVVKMITVVIQGFPKLTKSCSHFSKILPTTVDNKGRLYGK